MHLLSGGSRSLVITHIFLIPERLTRQEFPSVPGFAESLDELRYGLNPILSLDAARR